MIYLEFIYFLWRPSPEESPDTNVSDSSRSGIGALHGLLPTYPLLGTAPNRHDGEAGYKIGALCAREHQVRRGAHRESNHFNIAFRRIRHGEHMQSHFGDSFLVTAGRLTTGSC